MTKKMTFPRTFLVLAASALLGLACASSPAPSPETTSTAAAAPSGGAPAAAPAPAPAAAPAAPPAAAPPPAPLKNLPGMTVTWKDLDQDQKKQYMKKAVVTRMGDEFAGFNAKFNEFTCANCHGSGAKKGVFKMPNAELPKLPKDPEAMKKVAAAKPEWVMFMADMVKPHVADLLGMKPFDPKTKTGVFGCGNCHVME
jgi:mono/diheme cytochrome c family protein